MSDFHLLPPRPLKRTPGALIASLAIHGLLVVPYLVKSTSLPERHDPIDQMVTFLVPPDREGGREVTGDRGHWREPIGNEGASKEPVKTPEPAETVLELGQAGEPDPTPEPPSPPAEPEMALTEVEVDSAVVRDSTSAAPDYPVKLLKAHIEGATFVHYVVDTTGSVDPTSVEVVRSSHPEFANAVREALTHMRFRPAIQSSRKVRQWVEQNFAFRITPPRPAPADTT